MFKDIFNYSQKKSLKQALFFYLAHFVLLVIVGGLVSGILSTLSGDDSFEYGVKIGTIVAALGSLVASFLVLQKKRLLSNFVYVLVALLSGVLALFAGAFLGLIPAAWLSTK